MIFFNSYSYYYYYYYYDFHFTIDDFMEGLNAILSSEGIILQKKKVVVKGCLV